jgi:hypothetical protein
MERGNVGWQLSQIHLQRQFRKGGEREEREGDRERESEKEGKRERERERERKANKPRKERDEQSEFIHLELSKFRKFVF